MINLLFADINAPILYSLAALFFLAVGSLLNVIIYRLPLMIKADLLTECRILLAQKPEESMPVNLWFPRSFCPACKQQLKVWHNIPLVSYLLLGGKCQYCQHKIPFTYPLTELLTCMLSLYACWHFGFTLPLIFALLFIWIIIVLFFIDAHHQLLPDTLTLSLLWLGLIANTQSLFTSLTTAVLSAVGAYLFLWLFIRLFYLVTGKIGMGHGDFKLFSALGAWFGWTKLPLILIGSSTLGALAGMIYLKASKQSADTPIAFGPFLCIFAIVCLFFGNHLLQWYIAFIHP